MATASDDGSDDLGDFTLEFCGDCGEQFDAVDESECPVTGDVFCQACWGNYYDWQEANNASSPQSSPQRSPPSNTIARARRQSELTSFGFGESASSVGTSSKRRAPSSPAISVDSDDASGRELRPPCSRSEDDLDADADAESRKADRQRQRAELDQAAREKDAAAASVDPDDLPPVHIKGRSRARRERKKSKTNRTQGRSVNKTDLSVCNVMASVRVQQFPNEFLKVDSHDGSLRCMACGGIAIGTTEITRVRNHVNSKKHQKNKAGVAEGEKAQSFLIDHVEKMQSEDVYTSHVDADNLAYRLDFMEHIMSAMCPAECANIFRSFADKYSPDGYTLTSVSALRELIPEIEQMENGRIARDISSAVDGLISVILDGATKAGVPVEALVVRFLLEKTLTFDRNVRTSDGNDWETVQTTAATYTIHHIAAFLSMLAASPTAQQLYTSTLLELQKVLPFDIRSAQAKNQLTAANSDRASVMQSVLDLLTSEDTGGFTKTCKEFCLSHTVVRAGVPVDTKVADAFVSATRKVISWSTIAKGVWKSTVGGGHEFNGRKTNRWYHDVEFMTYLAENFDGYIGFVSTLETMSTAGGNRVAPAAVDKLRLLLDDVVLKHKFIMEINIAKEFLSLFASLCYRLEGNGLEFIHGWRYFGELRNLGLADVDMTTYKRLADTAADECEPLPRPPPVQQPPPQPAAAAPAPRPRSQRAAAAASVARAVAAVGIPVRRAPAPAVPEDEDDNSSDVLADAYCPDDLRHPEGWIGFVELKLNAGISRYVIPLTRVVSLSLSL